MYLRIRNQIIILKASGSQTVEPKRKGQIETKFYKINFTDLHFSIFLVLLQVQAPFIDLVSVPQLQNLWSQSDINITRAR